MCVCVVEFNSLTMQEYKHSMSLLFHFRLSAVNIYVKYLTIAS